jgi:aspartate/methionine/tyrosine aminotransferase
MADALRPSGIRAVFDRALALEAQGRSIVHLEIGRPHLGSPPVAAQAAIAALNAGDVHYTPNRGTPALRAALADMLAAAGRPYDADEEIVVTAGGSEAVFAAVRALLAPGDEVIVPTPAWPHYEAHARLADAIPVAVPSRAADGFVPDPERIAAAITPRTKAIIISSPSNPTGAVLDRDTLQALADLCLRHDLVAISDEIYRRFAYGSNEHISIATLPGMRERTVIADSCSKTYAMTGWRVGYAAAPKALLDRVATVHQYLTVCAPSFAQAGAVAALREGEPFVAAMVAEYGRRRDALRAGLAALPGVELAAADGAFYAFPRFTNAAAGGSDIAVGLLEDTGVATVPGAAFGAGVDGHLRISYAVSEAELDEGLTRLATVLNA